MQFFSSFPTIFINGKLLTDITLRLNYPILHWLSNPVLYYDYLINDDDTPDNLADRYYDDPNLYWIILVSNYILNPIFEFPLKQNSFEKFLNEKYKQRGGLMYTINTINPKTGYQKLITVTNETTKKVISKDYYIIDQYGYDHLSPENGLYTKYFEDSDQLYSYNVSKRTVTIYDEEYQANEEKRKIKILKKEYKQEAIFKLNTLVKNLK